MTKLAMTAGALAIALPTYTLAQDAGSSPFSAEFVIEIENDYTFDSSNPDNELNDTFATIEGALSFSLGPDTAINATLLIEPVLDATGDRFFEDHGLYAEELFLSHEYRGVEFVLGKFNPAFGMAWDVAPGIFGVDFAEDYELTERLGASATAPLFGDSHFVTVSVFQADRTILSDSIGEERGQLSLPSGGPSNTTGLESIAVSFHGEFGDTAYNVGFQKQEAGLGDASDQLGYVVGVTHTINTVELLGEIAFFDDFDGSASSAFYTTLGIAVPVGPVTLSGVYAHRDIDGAPTDDLFTVSAEMELAQGLTGAIGYRWADEGGDENQTFGTLLVYEF